MITLEETNIIVSILSLVCLACALLALAESASAMSYANKLNKLKTEHAKLNSNLQLEKILEFIENGKSVSMKIHYATIILTYGNLNLTIEDRGLLESYLMDLKGPITTKPLKSKISYILSCREKEIIDNILNTVPEEHKRELSI